MIVIMMMMMMLALMITSVGNMKMIMSRVVMIIIGNNNNASNNLDPGNRKRSKAKATIVPKMEAIKVEAIAIIKLFCKESQRLWVEISAVLSVKPLNNF